MDDQGWPPGPSVLFAGAASLALDGRDSRPARDHRLIYA
jgi:hypothetical protein